MSVEVSAVVKPWQTYGRPSVRSVEGRGTTYQVEDQVQILKKKKIVEMGEMVERHLV